MTKFVEWSEPWRYGTGPKDWVECVYRMTVEDAIKWQKGYAKTELNYAYPNDSDALLDFRDVRYGVIKEYNEV